MPDKLNPMGEFYRRAHLCPCGSGEVSDFYKDIDGSEVRACGKCKPKLLGRILEEKFMDIFEEWTKSFLSFPSTLGYQWQWEDFLKENGCERVIGLKEAVARRGEGFLIRCPCGDALEPGLEDPSAHVLVPAEYAERVMAQGRM